MDQNLARKNRRILAACVFTVAGMVGLSFAAVPLYNLFCRVTGYGGTTQVAEVGPAPVVGSREITIRFDSTVNPALPWRFHPEQKSVTLKVGEVGMAFYRAQSMSGQRTTGAATFNVTPLKAGQYFVKTQCFCFDEQVLDPNQTAEMPVSFYVDPAIMDDRNLDDTNTITLSYTFFRAEDDSDADGLTGVEGDADQTAALDQAATVN